MSICLISTMSNSTIRTVPVRTSTLGYAMLGIMQHHPCSGYDLRKIFRTTAMKNYSDSPGAIYPALRRLEQQRLIRGQIQQGSGLRRRQVFRVTAKGIAELKKWIIRPLNQDDVAAGLKEVMLRFAFSEKAAGPGASVQLLRALRAQLDEFVPTLHVQLKAGKAAMSRSARLALESGIRSYESLLEWTKYALATYAGKE